MTRMRLWAVLTTLALLIAACGTSAPPAPQWRGAAQAALADYIKLRLEGQTVAATRAYALAQERMRDGGDLDGLHTVLLTRCAMDVALLLPPDCSEFVKRGDNARAEALAYHAFLTGTLTGSQIAALPERYRAVAASTTDSSLAATISAIPEPVSRLIATGVATRAGRANEALLAASSDSARQQGWRAAHRAHEEARARQLEALGRTVEAAAAHARLRALYDPLKP